MGAITYTKDSSNIVTLSIDMLGQLNVMNSVFRAALVDAVAQLELETELRGVVIVSTNKVFLAGADLNEFAAVSDSGVADLVQLLDDVKALMAKLEDLPVPVVAAINGAALGGGFELCLACDYRIAVDHPGVMIGLPEVHLGLLPAGGGVVRLVNSLGLTQALPHLLNGSRLNTQDALQQGFIDAMVSESSLLNEAAYEYVLADSDADEAAACDANESTLALGDFLSESQLSENNLKLAAQKEIFQCALLAATSDKVEAYAEESRAVGRLIAQSSTKQLIQKFFAARQ